MQISDINLRATTLGPVTNDHKKAYHLIEALWKNKTPLTKPPNTTGFERVTCGYGADKFSIYHNNQIAYIAQWQQGQQHWYKTNV